MYNFSDNIKFEIISDTQSTSNQYKSNDSLTKLFTLTKLWSILLAWLFTADSERKKQAKVIYSQHWKIWKVLTKKCPRLTVKLILLIFLHICNQLSNNVPTWHFTRPTWKCNEHYSKSLRHNLRCFWYLWNR